jgi:hypothetical protein
MIPPGLLVNSTGLCPQLVRGSIVFQVVVLPGGPRVRIHFPPAASLQTLGPSRENAAAISGGLPDWAAGRTHEQPLQLSLSEMWQRRRDRHLRLHLGTAHQQRGRDCGFETFGALMRAEARAHKAFITRDLILTTWDRLPSTSSSPNLATSTPAASLVAHHAIGHIPNRAWTRHDQGSL